MKKFLFLSLAAVLLVACKPDKGYIIKGIVKDASFNDKMVYVQTADSALDIDSATIANGAFELRGAVDSAVVRYIVIGKDVDDKSNIIPVLLEPGSKLEITFDSIMTVKGNQVNEAYTEVRKKANVLRDKMNVITTRHQEASTKGTLNDSIEESLSNEMDGLVKDYIALQYDFNKNNMKNPLGEHIFLNNYYNYEAAQQRELIGLANEKFKSNPEVKKVIEKLDNLEKVSEGKKFADFTLKTPEGNDVKLSDYAGKGKYVLIDFWASWCGPCRNELPKVVKLYNKYKSKGFEIVGVSLDKNKTDWEKGIKDLKITWPQMSDLKAWDSAVVPMYGIQGIPYTVLLDKDGTIIANNLHGKDLENKFAELMP